MTKEQRSQVFEKYGGQCAYCGTELGQKFHCDHINPVWRDHHAKTLDGFGITRGENSLDNLNPSCASCNHSKGTYTIEQWREQLRQKVERLRRDSTRFRLLERFGLVAEVSNKVVFYFEKKQL